MTLDCDSETSWTERVGYNAESAKLVQQIRERRIELGLTQTDLAESSGITRSSFSHIENGTKQVSARTLIRIARAVGLRVALVPDVGADTQSTDPSLLSYPDLEAEDGRLAQLHNRMVDDLEAGRTPPAEPDDRVINRLIRVRQELSLRQGFRETVQQAAE